MAPNNSNNGRIPTNVDIVAIPAIGADARQPWIDDGSRTPWVTSELKRHIPNARVLLVDHGELGQEDTLDTLADRLLNYLQQQRMSTSSRRPLYFVCHSTGGLVATAALAIASRSDSNIVSILSSCYGIAFMGTPHYGSSYLSVPEFSRSIRQLLRLKHHIHHKLREVFRPRHEVLRNLARCFRAISADMKIWTFLETVDSVFTITDAETGSTVDMHVPITSIRSGPLGFDHESEIPLSTDHVGTATFKGQESTMRLGFIRELQNSISMALELSREVDYPLQAEEEVMVQVNGFFEDTARGVSDETPLKLWSTKTPLKEFLRRGPLRCLEERLKKSSSIQPSPYEDSSVSTFDSRPASANAESTFDGIQEAFTSRGPQINPIEMISPRPSMKRSRSFMIHPPSPRIHIDGPAVESYFDLQSESSVSDTRERILSREDLTRVDTTQEDDNDLAADNLGAMNPGQGNLLMSLRDSGNYGEFLHIPHRERSSEERVEMPKVAPRFDRPEPGSEKLLWIHVPYTHTDWVPQILRKVCEGQENEDHYKALINNENWFANLVKARHLEPHARYVRPACIHFKRSDSPPVTISEPHDPQLALYLPFLHWDTYRNLLQRRTIIEDRVKQGRSRPIPENISNSNLESKLIWKFLGSEPPIHIRRTLDQFGYPNLRSTVARDDDQMLWKRTRKSVNINYELEDSVHTREGLESLRSVEDGKVLMVDQLWLWIVDRKTVVTFFPRQEPTSVEDKFYEQTNLYNSIYNELNGDLARRFETAGDLAALIVLHAVTVLLDRTLHNDLQILRIFEESISILTELTTKSFKQFRSRGFITRPSEYNKTPEGKTMTAAEREERDRQVAHQNRNDLSSLLELRDIVDELGTLMKLLEQQTVVVRNMATYFEYRGYGRRFVQAALTRLSDYRNHITEMRENATAAQKAVENLLDLRQKQANVDESRLARWEAEVTQSQSRAVMVFTIFTVIFLPLSFFTSLFGINAREWSGEPTNLTLDTMMAIAGPTSIAIIVVALLLAFNERLLDTTVKTRIVAAGLIKDLIILPVSKTFRWEKPPQKTSIKSTKSSPMRDRFGRYLATWRPQRDLEDDFWKRDGNRSTPLPSVLVSEVQANNSSEKVSQAHGSNLA